MSKVIIEEKKSNVLWRGDTIVLGGSIDAVSLAVGSARQGLKSAIVTEDAMFGKEVTMCWNNKMPINDVTTRVFGFCNERNASIGGCVDPVLASVAFDNIIKSSCVTPFVRVMPMRLLKDNKGKLIGVEVVGKSGRQAMLADNVVDATVGRYVSYNYLGESRPSVNEVQWMGQIAKINGSLNSTVFVVPEMPNNVSENIEIMPSVWSGECFFKMSIKTDYSKPSVVYSTAAEIALSFYNYLLENNKQFKNSVLVDIAPLGKRIFGWNLNENALFSKFKQTGVFVLPTNIADSEKTLEINEIVEQLRMFKNSRRKLPKSPKLPGEMVEVVELTDTSKNQKDIVLPLADAFIECGSSVLVAGAGTGGIYAAIHSAGRGQNTTVLDAMHVPGGICTLGRINAYFHGLDSDMQTQLDSVERNLYPKPVKDHIKSDTRYHSLIKSIVFMRYIRNSRVNYEAGHFVFGCLKKNKMIESVLTASEEGYHLFPAKMFVDATGDGDLAVACGAEYTLGRETDGLPQPYSCTAFHFHGGILGGRNFDAGWVDPTDTLDYSRAHLEGRALYKNKIEYSDSHHFFAMAPLLGIRESRLIKGETVLTIDDAMSANNWDDVVLSARANYDNHSVDMAAESTWAYRWCVLADCKGSLFTVNIPFRALLPKEVDNLVMGAKTLSVDHDVQQLFRMQKDLFALGQVVSTACSIAIKSGKTLKTLNVDVLQEELKKQNLLPGKAVAVVDDSSHTEILKQLFNKPGDEENMVQHRRKFIGKINKLAIYKLGACPKISDLAMKRFLNKCDDNEVKLSVAIGFVLNGCNPDVVEDILKEGMEYENEEVLTGGSFPLKYRCMLALLECSSENYLDDIEQIMYALMDQPKILVCLIKGLENISPKKAVPIIRAFLVKTENEEFMMPMAGNPPEDKTSYRFTIELQAVASLQKLGCFDESRRLSKYVNSNNLLIKKYANKLKKEAKGKSSV